MLENIIQETSDYGILINFEKKKSTQVILHTKIFYVFQYEKNSCQQLRKKIELYHE